MFVCTFMSTLCSIALSSVQQSLLDRIQRGLTQLKEELEAAKARIGDAEKRLVEAR